MFKVLNRNYKQTFYEIIEEFPVYRFAIRAEDKDAEAGYLLAISTDETSDKEFRDFVVNDPNTDTIVTGGVYATGDPFLISYT